MGLFFISIGIILIIISFVTGKFENISIDSIGVGQIAAGIFMLLYYNFELKKQYLIIGNGFIKQNSPFGKNINLAEIKRIEKFAGDYIIKTDNKKLTINTQIIDSNSLADLNTELEKLNLEWN